MRNYVGKSHTFPDGNRMEIIQSKVREIDNETQLFLTIMTYQGKSLPRKTVMTYKQFEDAFGHLFADESSD